VGDGVPPATAARVAHGGEQDGEPASSLGRHGGGSGSVAVGRADRAVRGLARDAARLDVDAIRRRVVAHFGEYGVAATWSQVVVPLMQSLGSAYERTPERVVPIEHTASAGVLAALHSLPPAPERGRLPALLACAPDEQHSLPLEALRAALAAHDVPTRFLGPRLPADNLCEVAKRLRPAAVVVWAHRSSLARRVPLEGVAGHCASVLLGGPGWASVRAARPHRRPASLDEAMWEVMEASGRG
jgi:MerR family transcriptional regulator, light-induced transcriptional regulator